MFKFSQKSLDRLTGVHPDLVFVMKEAIKNSPIDFGVVEGLRTIERQKHLVAKGLSQTMKSKHLPQEDGYGHAVDLVPYVNGKPSWEWPAILEMAEVISTVVTIHPSFKIRWGGAWTSINTTKSMKELKDNYVNRCRTAGRTPFLDGPHFELA